MFFITLVPAMVAPGISCLSAWPVHCPPRASSRPMGAQGRARPTCLLPGFCLGAFFEHYRAPGKEANREETRGPYTQRGQSWGGPVDAGSSRPHSGGGVAGRKEAQGGSRWLGRQSARQ